MHGQLYAMEGTAIQCVVPNEDVLYDPDERPVSLATVRYERCRFYITSAGRSGLLEVWTVGGRQPAITDLFDAILNDNAKAVASYVPPEPTS